MIKRILEIITFPFYLIYLLISFPYKVLKIVLEDKNVKIKGNGAPSRHKNLKLNNDKELLQIGQLLFYKSKSEFETFYNSFLSDKKHFLSKNAEILESYDNFELKNLKSIEVIYIFGDSKQKLCMTDWKGEENEREIESFIENKLKIKTNWSDVNKFRKSINEEVYGKGEFIIDLLRAIDKDLNRVNKRLIFLDLDWDAYVFTVVEQNTYNKILEKSGVIFHGIEKL